MLHLARGALSAQRLSALAPAYRRRRRPTETVLYSLVREHLETFLAHARESYAAPLPKYVESEFREYLRCGVFAHGFLRARCEACDHDLVVAFSCKLRGICPSCAGRRMANTAAQLVDRVLSSVPVRQRSTLTIARRRHGRESQTSTAGGQVPSHSCSALAPA